MTMSKSIETWLFQLFKGSLKDHGRSDGDAHRLSIIREWLDRGYGVAVYELLMANPLEEGHKQWISYGAHSTQLGVGDPPYRMPTEGSNVYELIATVRRTDKRTEGGERSQDWVSVSMPLMRWPNITGW